MLYIMRHGRTDWNNRHKLQGNVDIPLNAEGMEMAKNAAERYKDVHFDVCYCSPLVRARRTAELLLEGREVPIVIDERLREMSFGEYEGTENCFEIPDCPIRVFFKAPEKYVAPEGAESLEELFARTGAFLDEVALPAVEEGKDVLIVGHGAMNSAIITKVRNNPLEKFWDEEIKNCKLIQLI